MRDVTDASFEADVLRAGKPVFVGFWAPWCGPCKAIHPILEQLAGETDAVEFVKLDIDENPVHASRYDVPSIPTVILSAAGEARRSSLARGRPSTSARCSPDTSATPRPRR